MVSENLPFYLIGSSRTKHDQQNDRYNAFTPKATHKFTKFNIGKPPSVPKSSNTNRVSHFRRLYLNGHLPFDFDVTGHSYKISRLAWKTNIQELELETLLPICVEGLSDTVPKFSDMAELAIENIFAHANAKQLKKSFTNIIEPFKLIFRQGNSRVIQTSLKAVRAVLTILKQNGEIPESHYKSLFAPLAIYIDDYKNMGDGIYYTQNTLQMLPDAIFDTIRYLESLGTSRSERKTAYTSFKSVMPVFESGVFPIKPSNCTWKGKVIENNRWQNRYVSARGIKVEDRKLYSSNRILRIIDINNRTLSK